MAGLQTRMREGRAGLCSWEDVRFRSCSGWEAGMSSSAGGGRASREAVRVRGEAGKVGCQLQGSGRRSASTVLVARLASSAQSYFPRQRTRVISRGFQDGTRKVESENGLASGGLLLSEAEMAQHFQHLRPRVRCVSMLEWALNLADKAPFFSRSSPYGVQATDHSHDPPKFDGHSEVSAMVQGS